MLSPEDKDYYVLKILNPNLGYLARKALRKQILEKAKKTTKCPNCKDINGTVKKAGMLKIVHEKYKNKKKQESIIEEKLLTDYRYVVEHNKEIKNILQTNGLVYTLNPVQVRRFEYYFQLWILRAFYSKLCKLF